MNLPVEVILKIFILIDLEDLENIKKANKWLRSVYTINHNWIFSNLIRRDTREIIKTLDYNVFDYLFYLKENIENVMTGDQYDISKIVRTLKLYMLFPAYNKTLKFYLKCNINYSIVMYPSDKNLDLIYQLALHDIEPNPYYHYDTFYTVIIRNMSYEKIQQIFKLKKIRITSKILHSIFYRMSLDNLTSYQGLDMTLLHILSEYFDETTDEDITQYYLNYYTTPII